MTSWTEQAHIAAELLSQSNIAVAFSGAGISTESGIPDFRSPGGVWANNRPVYFDEFLASAAARHEYWRQKCIADRDLRDARPSVGHVVLADWEARGRLRGVITQNIDELHRLAGTANVLELHGTARKVGCLDCGTLYEAARMVDDFLRSGQVPPCERCGGMLKHATVSFGQQLSPEVLLLAEQWSRECDVMLAIGSSLVVHPAADLPQIATAHGAKLVIINRDPTPLDHLASAVIRTSIGAALAWIDRHLHPQTDALHRGN